MPGYTFGMTKNMQAFTLVEFIITVAIASIVMVLTVPITNLIQKDRLNSESHDFVAALNYARSEAIARGARVTVCRSENSSTCNTSGSGPTEKPWHNGWIIFVDDKATDDGGKNGEKDVEETLLRIHEPLSKNHKLYGNTNVADFVSYVGSGQTRLAGGGFQAGTFALCKNDEFNKDSKVIVISSTGRITNLKGPDSDETTCLQ